MAENYGAGSEARQPSIDLFFNPFMTRDGRGPKEFAREFAASGDDKEKSRQKMFETAEAVMEIQIEYVRPQYGRVTSTDVAERMELEARRNRASEKLNEVEEKLQAHDRDAHPNVNRDLIIHGILYFLIVVAGTVTFAKWFELVLPEMPWWFGWALSPLVSASTALLPRFCRELDDRWQRRFRTDMLGIGILVMFLTLILLGVERKIGAHLLAQYQSGITEQQLFDAQAPVAPGNEPYSDWMGMLVYVLLGVAEYFIAGGLALCIKRDLEAREKRASLVEQVKMAQQEKDAIHTEWSRVNMDIERRGSFERLAANWKTQELARLEQLFEREWALKEAEDELTLKRIRRLSSDDGRAAMNEVPSLQR